MEINTLRPKNTPPFVCLIKAKDPFVRDDGSTTCFLCACINPYPGSCNAQSGRPASKPSIDIPSVPKKKRLRQSMPNLTTSQSSAQEEESIDIGLRLADEATISITPGTTSAEAIIERKSPGLRLADEGAVSFTPGTTSLVAIAEQDHPPVPQYRPAPQDGVEAATISKSQSLPANLGIGRTMPTAGMPAVVKAKAGSLNARAQQLEGSNSNVLLAAAVGDPIADLDRNALAKANYERYIAAHAGVQVNATPSSIVHLNDVAPIKIQQTPIPSTSSNPLASASRSQITNTTRVPVNTTPHHPIAVNQQVRFANQNGLQHAGSVPHSRSVSSNGDYRQSSISSALANAPNLSAIIVMDRAKWEEVEKSIADLREKYDHVSAQVAKLLAEKNQNSHDTATGKQSSAAMVNVAAQREVIEKRRQEYIKAAEDVLAAKEEIRALKKQRYESS